MSRATTTLRTRQSKRPSSSSGRLDGCLLHRSRPWAAFPAVLRDAGFTVERHRDHFAPDCPDEDWLAEAGGRDWVAITHDARIRYKPNELAAVIQHRVRLLVIVGKAAFPDLAASFVATRERIEASLEHAPRPVIAKVYRATPAQLAANLAAPGRIERWYPK